MRLRDFLLTSLVLAASLRGGSWAQRPEIASRVANAEGKRRLLPRALLPGGSSGGVRLRFPCRADASAAPQLQLAQGAPAGAVLAEESGAGRERICEARSLLVLFGSFCLVPSCQVLWVPQGRERGVGSWDELSETLLTPAVGRHLSGLVSPAVAFVPGWVRKSLVSRYTHCYHVWFVGAFLSCSSVLFCIISSSGLAKVSLECRWKKSVQAAAECHEVMFAECVLSDLACL